MSSWRSPYSAAENQNPRQWQSNRKPPVDGWKGNVPTWEKKFCYEVGFVPWRKLLETKKVMYLYRKVVNWKDSAVEEAFNNAKTRFWAKINGLPCDISLPGPDDYIDEVDWNSKVDEELLLDLERDSPPKNNGEQGVIMGSALHGDQVPCNTGWSDGEDGVKNDVKEEQNPWEYKVKELVTGDMRWGVPACDPSAWENGNYKEGMNVQPHDWYVANRMGNGRKRGRGWYASKSKSPKVYDGCGVYRGWGGENRSGFGCRNGNYTYGKQPLRKQWIPANSYVRNDQGAERVNFWR